MCRCGMRIFSEGTRGLHDSWEILELSLRNGVGVRF